MLFDFAGSTIVDYHTCILSVAVTARSPHRNIHHFHSTCILRWAKDHEIVQMLRLNREVSPRNHLGIVHSLSSYKLSGGVSAPPLPLSLLPEV
jgi:hypothetical protein